MKRRRHAPALTRVSGIQNSEFERWVAFNPYDEPRELPSSAASLPATIIPAAESPQLPVARPAALPHSLGFQTTKTLALVRLDRLRPSRRLESSNSDSRRIRPSHRLSRQPADIERLRPRRLAPTDAPLSASESDTYPPASETVDATIDRATTDSLPVDSDFRGFHSRTFSDTLDRGARVRDDDAPRGELEVSDDDDDQIQRRSLFRVKTRSTPKKTGWTFGESGSSLKASTCCSSSSSSTSSSSFSISSVYTGDSPVSFLPSLFSGQSRDRRRHRRRHRRPDVDSRLDRRSSQTPRKTSSSSSSSLSTSPLPFVLLRPLLLIALTLSGSQSPAAASAAAASPGSASAAVTAAAVSPVAAVPPISRVGRFSGSGRELIQVGFETVLNETSKVPCPIVTGKVPRWLSGYFLRHTPGTYGQENRPADPADQSNRKLQSIDHLFDGLAMVSSYELKGGDVRFSNKYLRTHGFKIWEHFGKDMSKSLVAWGTTFSKMDWEQAFKWRQNFTEPQYFRGNPNVNFWRINDKIQAVDESAHGLLFEIKTLDTKSTYLFEDDSLAPGYGTVEKVIHPAHEQVDLDGSVWNVLGVFTIDPVTNTPDQANWTVYRVEDGVRRVPVGSTPIGPRMFDLEKCFDFRHYPEFDERAGYMHSFAMSRDYVILPVVPYFLDYCALFSRSPNFGHGAFFRTYMQAQPAQGLKFHIMRKSDGRFLNSFVMAATDNIFVTHQVNAFEDDANKILHVDMLTYKSTDVYQTAYIESILQEAFARQEATIERFSISLVNYSLISRRPLSKPQPMEFPTINSQRFRQRDYRFVYLVTRPYLTGSTIVKLDVKTGNMTHWGPETGVFPSEAVFVPTPHNFVDAEPAEDDGVLLSGLLDAKTKKGYVLVLNATTMEEIARARAPISTPFGLHNRFFSHAEILSESRPSTTTPGHSGATSSIGFSGRWSTLRLDSMSILFKALAATMSVRMSFLIMT